MKAFNNLFGILILTLTCSALSVFAGEHPKANQLNSILVMQGDTSIFKVEKVTIIKTKNKLVITMGKGGEKIILKGKRTLYRGKFSDQNGKYAISCKLSENDILKGNFTFEPSEHGKKKYYLKDKGILILEKFTEEEFKKWRVLSVKQIKGYNNNSPMSELVKHSPYIREINARFREETKNDNIPIKFYGKVIDQFGKPVVNAEVELGIRFTPLLMWSNMDKNFKLHTNKNGLFTLSGKGKKVIIDKIHCNGYRTSFNGFKGENSFNYKACHNPFVADPKKPAVFVMSKITDKATFLINNDDFNIYIKQNSEKLYAFINLEAKWENAGYNRHYMKEFLPKHYDIKVSAIFDKNKSNWIVTLTASGKQNGFIINDNLLDEAPKTGYKKEFKFIQHVLTKKEKVILLRTEDSKVRKKYNNLMKFVLKEKYLYIKSREPAIYTRMDLEGASIDRESFNIFTSIMINPYGERNLEYNDEFPYQITDKLKESATEAFLKGKLPEKPNIKKIFDEFKKTHKRVKNKDYGFYEWIKK